MKSFYIFIVLIFIFHLNSISGQSYVHRQREPPHHEQMSYISPVTYQAKASFGTPENVVTRQISRETVRHHLPRELVVRRQVPVTYQTYDRRALGVQEPVAVPRPSVSQVRYVQPRVQYAPSHPTSATYAQIHLKDHGQKVYQTAYNPAIRDIQQYHTQRDPQQYTQRNVIRYDYNRGATRRDDRYVSKSDARRTPHTNSDYSRRTFYGQPAPRRIYEYRRLSRPYDPCVNLYDGQYVLNHDFKKLFPYVDNMCYFVKCANKKAYLNACGPATRNDKKGQGFCSHLDLEGFCGPSLHEYHEKKRKDDSKERRHDYSYSSPTYSGASHRSGDRTYTRHQR